MSIYYKYLASSFIIIYSIGKKMYLSNTVDDLEEQMKSEKKTIEVTTSHLYSKTFVLFKKNIEAYGRC